MTSGEPTLAAPAYDDEAAPPPRRSRWGALLRAVLVLALAGLVAAGVLLGLAWRHHRDRDADRQAALAAARQEAVNLTTMSYRHADADIQRILAAATGDLHKQFTSERTQLAQVLSQAKSESTGTALEAGVVSLRGDTARVLVAADASVVNDQTRQAKSAPVVKHYRMAMTVQRLGGRWLVSSIGFTGVPQ